MARLQEFSRGLLGKMDAVEGVYLAGGSVANALCSDIWLGTDLDFFLVGQVSVTNMQTLQSLYGAFCANTLDSGKFKTILATRTNTSVTFFSSAEEHRRPPPLQVILRVYGTVGELLARFDVASPKPLPIARIAIQIVALAQVDCCACAYEVATQQFFWTERCRRAFRYGANSSNPAWTPLRTPIAWRNVRRDTGSGWRCLGCSPAT